MRLLIFGDNHWCKYSSILRGRGTKYSLRLENQIKSLEWVNDIAIEYDCNAIVCDGDFFDKPMLDSEEITALSEVRFKRSITFIVGNHESDMSDLSYNSTNALEGIGNKITSPYTFSPSDTDFEICFLPYVREENRVSLKEVFGEKKKKRIIISHNDIKMQYGQYVSKTGYDISDIEENCDLFFNGHLHNATTVGNKIVLVGNLTGQNFSEDAYKYKHGVIIFDTDTMSYEFVENPYALKFYQINENSDFNFGENAVVSAVVSEGKAEEVRKKLLENPNVITYKVIETRNVVTNNVAEQEDVSLAIDYLAKFSEYIKSTMGESANINDEISHICIGN